MSRRWRFALIIFGLTLACCSLMLLAYFYWPTETQNVTATLQPTLFISP